MQAIKLQNRRAQKILFIFLFLLFLLSVQVMPVAFLQPVFANKTSSLDTESVDLNLRDPFEGAEQPRPGIQLLQVINLGADVAKNVTLTFSIPEGTGFDHVDISKQTTCLLLPHGGTGNLVCSLGDIPPSQGVHITVYFSIQATPGTKISTEAQVTSDTPDVNPNNNIFRREFVVPGFPAITSIQILKDPFRIEVTTQNFVFNPLIGSVIGIGCDCRQRSTSLMFGSTAGVYILGGSGLKNLFPRGIPTQICLSDFFRGTMHITTFTR